MTVTVRGLPLTQHKLTLLRDKRPGSGEFRRVIREIAALMAYTSRPNLCLLFERSAGWYLIDFARSRHANPARIPVVGRDDWY